MGEIFREGFSFSGYERDDLYLNLGEGRFRNISGVSGIDSITDGRGSIFADFDNDGDLDVVVTTIQKRARLLYRNNVGQSNGFLRVALEGTESGRDAFGTVVRVKTPLGLQTKIKAGGSGFVSSHDPRLLFGLGEDPAIEWLEVTWPSGRQQRFVDVRPGDSVKLVEGAEAPRRVAENQFRLVDPEEPDAAAYRALAIRRGERLPAFPAANLAGDRTDLAQVRMPGRRMLVNFWATWCAPCRLEMRELQDLQPRLEDAGVDLVGVSLDFGETDRVREFLEKYDIGYPNLIAEEDSMTALVKGEDLSVPFSLLLDETGALLNAYSGWSRKTQKAFEGLTEGH